MPPCSQRHRCRRSRAWLACLALVVGLVIAAGARPVQVARDAQDAQDARDAGEVRDAEKNADPPGVRIRLATTTSTRDSGLLDHVLPLLRRDTGIHVDVVAVGSGQAFALARRGDVDLLMTHAPEGERELVEEGVVRFRRVFMYNHFVIVGPRDDPAGIAGLDDVLEAYRRLSLSAAARYLSRGDDSGTHRKERRLLAAAGIEPGEPWYWETGQGMGATLTIAWERDAYLLTDRATHAAHRRAHTLPVLVEGDARLKNSYALLVLRPELFPHVRAAAAERVANWLTSAAGRRAITGFRVNGQQLFFPLPVQTPLEDSPAPPPAVANGARRTGIVSLIVGGSRDVWGPAFLTLRCAALAALLAAPLAVPLGIFVGSGRGRFKRLLRALVEAGLAIPTTAVALLLYLLLSRGGWFGAAGLLYSPTAIVLGQMLVALPVVLLLTSDATHALDPRVALTARTIGASPLRRGLWVAQEIRSSVVAALFAAFGRAAGEIGVALILGGNIRDRTRTLTTAIQLETSRGEFERALALGVLLVILAFATILIVRLLSPRRGER